MKAEKKHLRRSSRQMQPTAAAGKPIRLPLSSYPRSSAGRHKCRRIAVVLSAVLVSQKPEPMRRVTLKRLAHFFHAIG